MNPFIIIGHGEENQVPFEERPRIPEGYALVTLAECGTVTHEEEVSRIIEAFGNPDNRGLFTDPRRNVAAIQGILGGHAFHFYGPGAKYPPMSVQLLADWESQPTLKTTSKQRVAVKSGLYSFPLNLATWRLRPIEPEFVNAMMGIVDVNGIYRPSFTNPADVATRIYGDSLLPTEAETVAHLAAAKNSVAAFKKRLYMPLEKIFARGGPGIYYYVICRSPAKNNFVGYLAQSINVPTHLDESRNAIQYIPEYMPVLEDLAAKKRAKISQKKADLAAKKGITVDELESTITTGELYDIEGWDAEETLGAPEKYRRLYNNTMRIRRMSAEQQAMQTQTGGYRRRSIRRSRTKKNRSKKVR